MIGPMKRSKHWLKWLSKIANRVKTLNRCNLMDDTVKMVRYNNLRHKKTLYTICLLFRYLEIMKIFHNIRFKSLFK